MLDRRDVGDIARGVHEVADRVALLIQHQAGVLALGREVDGNLRAHQAKAHGDFPSDGGSRLMVSILSGSDALVCDVARSAAADAVGADDSLSSVTTALAICCVGPNCAGGRWVSCWTTVTLVVSGKVSVPRL